MEKLLNNIDNHTNKLKYNMCTSVVVIWDLINSKYLAICTQYVNQCLGLWSHQQTEPPCYQQTHHPSIIHYFSFVSVHCPFSSWRLLITFSSVVFVAHVELWRTVFCLHVCWVCTMEVTLIHQMWFIEISLFQLFQNE